MIKTILARNAKTVRNIETKPWPYISGPRYGLLFLDLNSCIPGPESWIWILCLRFWLLVPGSWVTGPRSSVPVCSVTKIIT